MAFYFIYNVVSDDFKSTLSSVLAPRLDIAWFEESLISCIAYVCLQSKDMLSKLDLSEKTALVAD